MDNIKEEQLELPTIKEIMAILKKDRDDRNKELGLINLTFFGVRV